MNDVITKARQTLIKLLAKENKTFWLMSFALNLILLILFNVINGYFKFVDYEIFRLIQDVLFFIVALSFLSFLLIGYFHSVSNNNCKAHRLTQVIKILFLFSTLVFSLMALMLPKTVFLYYKKQHETIDVVWWENHYQPIDELIADSKLTLKNDKAYQFALLCQQSSPDIGYNETTFKLINDNGEEIFLQSIAPVSASNIFYFRRPHLKDLNLGFDLDQDRNFDYTNHRKYAWVSHTFYVPNNGHYLLSIDTKAIFDKQINSENLGCRTSGLFLVTNAYQNNLYETYLSYRDLFVATGIISFLLLMLTFYRMKDDYLDL